MALGTAAEWRQDGDVKDWMITKLQEGPPSDQLTNCKADAQWWEMFCLWGAKNRMDEGTDFINAVDEFRRTGDGNKAEQIFNEFLVLGAPREVNVSDDTAKGVRAMFAEDLPMISMDMFDATYVEVFNVLEANYRRFVQETSVTRRGLEEEQAGQQGGDEEVSRDTIDMAIVDRDNEGALKAMDEGESTNYFQIDDLVIIDHPGVRQDEQPYLDWARNELKAAGRRPGMITMTAKGAKTTGNLFGGAGTLTVTGAEDEDLFKKAIRRVSKKKIVFG